MDNMSNPVFAYMPVYRASLSLFVDAGSAGGIAGGILGADTITEG
jgi:hypothetical protein